MATSKVLLVCLGATAMCGIIGVVGRHGTHVNQLIYDGLTVLQHRGQDAAGIMFVILQQGHLHEQRLNLSMSILLMEFHWHIMAIYPTLRS